MTPEPTPEPLDERRATPEPTASRSALPVIAVGWLATVLVPLWIAGGRILTGTAGDLTLVYTLTLALLLAVLSAVGMAVPARRLGTGGRPSTRAFVALGLAWLCGVGLGLTLPDTGAGASSVLEAWTGPEASGVAAALSNPLAILMGFFALVGCVLAVRDSRPGGPARVTDEDEHQGSGHFPVWDV